MTTALPLTSPKIAVMELDARPSLLARQKMVVRDLREAAGLWRLCWTLAWLDIRLRYRGSVLGPFWLTLSTAIMVGAMAVLYASLFHIPLRDYIPFLALSLVLWNFFAILVAEACMSYTWAEPLIRSVRMPFTLYAARIVLRNALVFAHNVVVIIAVFALFLIIPGPGALLVLPAMAVWLVDAMALSMLLGAVCARFRDIPPIVASVMQMAFFVTPIIWKADLIEAQWRWLLPLNPIYAMLETLRQPLLGSPPPLVVYISAIGYSVALWCVTWLVFARVRSRIAFWV